MADGRCGRLELEGYGFDGLLRLLLRPTSCRRTPVKEGGNRSEIRRVCVRVVIPCVAIPSISDATLLLYIYIVSRLKQAFFGSPLSSMCVDITSSISSVHHCVYLFCCRHGLCCGRQIGPAYTKEAFGSDIQRQRRRRRRGRHLGSRMRLILTGCTR